MSMPTPAQLCEVTPQVGDWGTTFQLVVEQKDPADVEEECLTIPVDLTGATGAEITFQPPGGPAFVRTAQVVDAAAGIVQYVWQPGDLRWAGLWQAQAHVSTPTADWHSATATFPVRHNLGPINAWKDPRPSAVDLYLPQVAVVMT